jgi:hypothetical protein
MVKDGANPFQPFFDTWGAFMPAGLFAQQQLSQAILPGWSLISVNQGNSSAPDTEQAVVAKASYGRQLGRIMEALDVLVRAAPPVPPGKEHDGDRKAIAQFQTLVEEVGKAKHEAAEARVARIIADLESLKTHNVKEYACQCAALRRFLEQAGRQG